MLGPLITVEGYGIPVHLILYLGEDVEQFAVCFQADYYWWEPIQ